MVLLGHVPKRWWRVASFAGEDERRWTAVRQANVDLRVHDRVALDEIELYSEMLSAVASAERPLTVDEIDMVLGLGHAIQSGAPPWPPSPRPATARYGQCVTLFTIVRAGRWRQRPP